MGVSSSVSGSYLFNEASVGQALMNLTKRNLESQFLVRDFMIPLSECPVINESELTFESVLTVVENGKLGFCIVLGESNRFIGLISNADIRRGLLRNLKQLNDFSVNDFVNTNVVGLEDTFTVNRMLQELKLHDFPISYFPVWDKDKISVGIITFVNLIKGEL
jgi:Mg2+/Co2+ transporter CorC